ncbi:hypothetical protein P405_31900 [Streptomyces sp. FR-008]|nr:hypothetical protein P405_31900 [Streptomyces sp. FR-008]
MTSRAAAIAAPALGTRGATVSSSAEAVAPTLNALATHPMPTAP